MKKMKSDRTSEDFGTFTDGSAKTVYRKDPKKRTERASKMSGSTEDHAKWWAKTNDGSKANAIGYVAKEVAKEGKKKYTPTDFYAHSKGREESRKNKTLLDELPSRNYKGKGDKPNRPTNKGDSPFFKVTTKGK